jgi:polysaccharide export outer membrane protein
VLGSRLFFPKRAQLHGRARGYQGRGLGAEFPVSLGRASPFARPAVVPTSGTRPCWHLVWGGMSIPAGRSLRAMLCFAAIPMLASCAGAGEYVWFSQLPPAQAQFAEYLIDTGDLVDVKVLSHEDMSVLKQKVRADGRISIPIIGDVEARGKRPSALRAEIEGRLKDYFVSPSVTIAVDETPMTVACLGEVSKPGAYPLEPGAGLAKALASAGGLSDYANRDRIFVVRQRPEAMRIRFTYEWVLRNENHAASFPLRAGDTVVVE